MALRDQPYLPLYVQDYLTDEKLNECSAATQGVYIKIMCIMHKSETYGTILLKQKDKQTTEPIKNFASKLVKHLAFSENEIFEAIEELVSENVLIIEGDILSQKRMVKDNAISLVRANAGKKGGEFAQANIKAKAQAKTEANSEYENDNSPKGGTGENIIEEIINPKPLSEEEIKTLNSHASKLFNSQMDMEHIMKLFKLTQSHIKNLIKSFIEHLIFSESRKPKYKDFKSHFVNWLRIKQSKGEFNTVVHIDYGI